ncbi:hypothetical protein BDN67DRAFT_1012623 [Paxillus ammoniavirescens]|nr:hypothetical protein BDN67DRAFT_1012623 [Paxillus ammoniavirescens]
MANVKYLRSSRHGKIKPDLPSTELRLDKQQGYRFLAGCSESTALHVLGLTDVTAPNIPAELEDQRIPTPPSSGDRKATLFATTFCRNLAATPLSLIGRGGWVYRMRAARRS